MQSERDQIQQRITNAFTRLSQRGDMPRARHFIMTRQGTEMRIVCCWCEKARRVPTDYPNVFVRDMNDFLLAHEACEPKESR